MDMPSLWAFLDSCHERSPQFYNFAYKPAVETVLVANTSTRQMLFVKVRLCCLVTANCPFFQIVGLHVNGRLA